MTRLIRLVIAQAALLLALLPAQQAAAVSLEVVVNGVPITDYDISQRVALQRLTGVTPSTSSATQQLIDEAVQITAAIDRGIVVSDAQVDAAFAQIAGRVGMNLSQFNSALLESGVQPDTLKRQITAQIYWSILVQARLTTNPVINQQDVTTRLLQQGGDTRTIREYRLHQIIFVVPDGSSSSYVNQRRSEAEAFRQRFAGCDNTFNQAVGLRDVTVRDIGRDTSGLNEAQVQSLEGRTAGQTTRPERTSLGIEVLAVCAVADVQANEQARTQIQNELLLQQSDQIGLDYLAELREDAIIIRY